jgi:hypothetical protein
VTTVMETKNASEVADHASAAEYVFHTKDVAGAKAEG